MFVAPARMKTLACRFTLVAAAVAPLGFAWATTTCTKSEAQAAEDRVGRLTSWRNVYGAFRQFAHCDDGSIGQGLSESITLLLATKWGRIVQLKHLIATDPGFEAFVLRHIDLTVPVERLHDIAANANERCPKQTAALCRKLARRATDQ